MSPIPWLIALSARRTTIAILAICVGPLAAQVRPPSADSLAGITERGKILAEYDQAAWHATDAVMLLTPAENEIQGYVAQRQDGVWVVSFGRVSPDGRAFMVAYEARESSTEPHSFAVTKHKPAKSETGDLAGAARAALYYLHQHTYPIHRTLYTLAGASAAGLATSAALIGGKWIVGRIAPKVALARYGPFVSSEIDAGGPANNRTTP